MHTRCVARACTALLALRVLLIIVLVIVIVIIIIATNPFEPTVSVTAQVRARCCDRLIPLFLPFLLLLLLPTALSTPPPAPLVLSSLATLQRTRVSCAAQRLP